MGLKSRKRLKITLIVLIITFSVTLIALSLVNTLYLKSLKKTEEFRPIKISEYDEFDVLQFWDREIERANNTDLGIKYGDKDTIKYTNPYTDEDYEFKTKEIYFNSPNWVGEDEATIKLHGYLIFPEDEEAKNPGALVMHGLGGTAEAAFGLAMPYLEEGFIVLCYDHPGHGDSEGAKPKPSNFYYDDEFNESAHFYLTIMGAFQGLRVLETHNKVDNASIMVTGGSYGALNTMWLSSIVGTPRIDGALPYIAVGDIEKTLKDPSKLIFWVWDKSPSEIDEDWWDKEERFFDAKHYLEAPNLPPILWQVGTTDEFFHRHSINGTYEAVEHDDAYLQIFPNGHHGFPAFENNTKFWIDYCVKNGSAPPSISVKKHVKEFSILGDTLKITAKVKSGKDIASVQAAYYYVDIIGASWQLLDLKETEDDTWIGTLNPGIITSNVEYYIIVTLEGEENVWFSSKIYTAGVLISYTTIPFYIMFIAAISIPVAFLVWRRYKKNVAEQDIETQAAAKKMLLIELLILAITESILYIAIFLPWAVFENGGVVFTHIYIMNKLYTADLIFGDIALYLPYIYLMVTISFSLLALMKPMASGFLRMWYPILVVVIITMLGGWLTGGGQSAFGIASPGIGVWLTLGSAIAVFAMGIWKRKYQTKLGIRDPKTKRYNVDRWFRINKLGKKDIQAGLDLKNIAK